MDGKNPAAPWMVQTYLKYLEKTWRTINHPSPGADCRVPPAFQVLGAMARAGAVEVGSWNPGGNPWNLELGGGGKPQQPSTITSLDLWDQRDTSYYCMHICRSRFLGMYQKHSKTISDPQNHRVPVKQFVMIVESPFQEMSLFFFPRMGYCQVTRWPMNGVHEIKMMTNRVNFGVITLFSDRPKWHVGGSLSGSFRCLSVFIFHNLPEMMVLPDYQTQQPGSSAAAPHASEQHGVRMPRTREL